MEEGDDGGEPEAEADAHADAESGPDAAASDASSAGDDRLQPFEVGRRWTYTRTPLDPARDAECPGPLESYVAGTVQRDGETGWDYRPTCVDASVQMFFDGDDIWAYVGDSTQRTQYASAPVEDGRLWQAGGNMFAWEEQERIEVPAGSFEHCFRRVEMSRSEGSFILLCRGVGLVVTHNVVGNYRLELSEKNF